MKETWKNIDGYKNMYSVSNFGRVKSLARKNRKKEKIMKLECRAKHFGISLYINGTKKYYSIHRLVANHFMYNPNNYPFVCHKDDNTADNSIKNLYWGTHQDNMNDMVNNGKSCKGEKRWGERNPMSILTEDKVLKIKKLSKNKQLTNTQLATRFSISRQAIVDIVYGRTWKHIIL
jgi:hypothetical protein